MSHAVMTCMMQDCLNGHREHNEGCVLGISKASHLLLGELYTDADTKSNTFSGNSALGHANRLAFKLWAVN